MGNNSQFSYDGLWRNTKIVETVSGSVTSTKQFVWCDLDRCESRDGASTVISRYYVDGQTTSGQSFCSTRDQLGSTREFTASNGTLQAQYFYDPYGSPITIQGTQDPDFQFAGYYLHQRSKLNLTLTRSYNSTIGRWTSRDIYKQIEFSRLQRLFADTRGVQEQNVPFMQALAPSIAPIAKLLSSRKPGMEQRNLYKYVNQNPVSAYDPYGLQAGTAIGTMALPGPGTVIGAAADVAIGLGVGVLAVGIMKGAWDYGKRLQKTLCKANAHAWYQNCRDRILMQYCPLDPDEPQDPKDKANQEEALNDCVNDYNDKVEACDAL